MSEEFIKLARFENDKIMRIAKEIVFNPNEPFTERFEGLIVLMENAALRIQQLQQGEKRLQAVYRQFCEKAINLHKQNKIKEFTERWQGKEVCEEMAEEMRMIEKPNHCYKFAGSKVLEQDCSLCNKRCDHNEPYGSSFIDLLEEKTTDDIPDGTKAPIGE